MFTSNPLIINLCTTYNPKKRLSCYTLKFTVLYLQTHKHSITNLYATGTGRGEPPRKLLLSDDGLRLGTGDVWYFVCII